MLNHRRPTNSVCDTQLVIEGKTFHFYDLSGLRHHRMQWLKYFAHVHVVLFVTSLVAYDQTLSEDATINRMTDALVLFEHIAMHPMLSNVSIVLFFNKFDLFSKKVKKVPIKLFFPDYIGILILIRTRRKCFKRSIFFQEQIPSPM